MCLFRRFYEDRHQAVLVGPIAKLPICIQAPALDVIFAGRAGCDQHTGMILADRQLPGSRQVQNELRGGIAGLRVNSQLTILIRAPTFHGSILQQYTGMSETAICIGGIIHAADRLEFA